MQGLQYNRKIITYKTLESVIHFVRTQHQIMKVKCLQNILFVAKCMKEDPFKTNFWNQIDSVFMNCKKILSWFKKYVF